ncbi:hypothetical protein [Chryseobacterium koreense]|uniref:hypothetical protein n=1 Tax=Chryseobacterium koreense TaxID=232216 RepID=UPI0026F1B1F0|nr:hypothetical protein [Chryseobacterium koreense]
MGGLITLKQIYPGGTKMMVQAASYTFVWGNAIETNKERMRRQLEELWLYAESIASEEDNDRMHLDIKKSIRRK